MNIALLYFSGTGNTQWLAETLAANLKEKGAAVDLFSLEEPIEMTTSYDRYLVAHPVYGAHVPRIVSERVVELIRGNIHLTVITTFGYVNALGYFAEKNALGRDIDAYYNVRMFNNISTPTLKTPIKSLDQRLQSQNKITARIEEIADAIINDRSRIEGIGPQLIVGIRIRKMMNEKLHSYYRTLGVDPERCIRCNLCVRECPTHSISEQDGTYTFHATCTTCTRCYNMCPAQAITIDGKYADPEKYPRYTGPWD